MKFSRGIAYAIAFMTACIAAVALYVYVSRAAHRPGKAAPPGEKVSVLTAATNIPAETVIEPEHLSTTEIPAADLPRHALTDPEEAVGKVAQIVLSQGHVIVRTDVGAPGPQQGLAYVVNKGERAMTIPIDPITGVAGFLKPGYRVDVLATFTQDEATVSMTVVQDVRLLAIGPAAQPTTTAERSDQETARKPAGESSATLAVTPGQAEDLLLAVQKGQLHLVLRNPDDTEQVALIGRTQAELTGLKPKAAGAPAAQAPAGKAAGYERPPEWWDKPPSWMAEYTAQAKAATRAQKRVEILRGTEREVVNLDE